MWLVIVASVRFFRSFFDAHASYNLTVLGADIGNTLALGMVKKALNYSVLCNKNFKMGELANLLQVDCFRIALFPKNLSSVISLAISRSTLPLIPNRQYICNSRLQCKTI